MKCSVKQDVSWKHAHTALSDPYEVLFIGVILPNTHGSCAFLPKVADQLEELETRKVTDGQEFPGSGLSFSSQQRSIWMTEISDIRPIGRIIWPGTHYSATNQIGVRFITRPFGQRQTLSVYDQLKNGVRALDIRIQHNRRVCNGNILSNTTVDDVIGDIKMFLEETEFEIIFLEIQTERGYEDPKNFEAYLVHQLGDLLIHQDDQVFSKRIVEVLPRRIICFWKPNNSPMPKVGSPIWSRKYLEGDEMITQMPLTKFEGNINKLKERASDLNVNSVFYKVDNTIAPQATSLMERLLVWPRFAKVVSKRINDFARLFLAKCNAEGVLHRLQICSVDFVEEDFISACIALNYKAEIQSFHSESLVVTDENMFIPDDNGSSSGLFEINEELGELKTLLKSEGDKFDGSRTLVDHPETYRWMEYFLLQQLPINMIAWPGTHNSATHNIGAEVISHAFVQCQSSSVYEQLCMGVRALDVRIQQDRLICHGAVVASYGIDSVIGDINQFINETKQEIILLEVRTEEGQTDPPNFEQYLIDQLGEFLIHQDDEVFTKSISEVLPKRIICFWKPQNSASPAPGSPLWSGDYIRADSLNTDKPLTKFNSNKSNLNDQIEVSERMYFYKVEHTMTGQTDIPVALSKLLTGNVETLSRRLRPFARLFLRRCDYEVGLDKLQIFSEDFIDHDFIASCIQISHDRNYKRITAWVSKYDSITISPRDLVIAHGDNPDHWEWTSWCDNSNDRFEVTELTDVCWLDVNGKFDVTELRAGTTYEVIYVIVLRSLSHENGLDHINLRLTLPNGDTEEREENLDDKPRNIPLTISVGTFTVAKDMEGEIQFSLDECESGSWKKGLVVISVVLKAIKYTSVENWEELFAV